MSIIIRIAICVRILWSCRMRVSRDDAARNRTKVVEAAAENFRKRGHDRTGVVGPMADAGLTPGCLSQLFADKEVLVLESTTQDLAQYASSSCGASVG